MTKDEAQQLAEQLAQGSRVVDAEQLRRAGVDADLVKSMLRTRWQRAVPGVYVIDRDPVDRVTTAHVALRVGGDSAMISGWLALVWMGLPWVPEMTTILVLVDADTKRLSRGWVYLRRTLALPTLGTWTYNGVPVVRSVAQAVVDTTRQISTRKDWSPARRLQEARGVVLGAIGAQRTDVTAVRAVLGAGAINHSKLARRVCVDAERGAASPPEAEMADDAMKLGVPFVLNPEVWVDGRFVGKPDGWLIGTGVGWEGDSEERHGEASLLDSTLTRWERFIKARVVSKHVTPKRYRADPGAFWAGMIAEVRERQALGLGDPPGLELRRAPGPVLQGSNDDPPYVVDLARAVLPTPEEPPTAA